MPGRQARTGADRAGVAMNSRGKTEHKGIIAWFAANHVAANLLMYLIIVAGLLSASTIRKQMQPDFELNNVQVQVQYLGAAPQEVEEGVVIKVEEAIQDVDGIEKLVSSASEGVGTVTAEVSRDADLNEVLSEIKTRVDAISTFPALTEKPVISKVLNRREVASLVVYGNVSERSLREQAEAMRDELLAMDHVAYIRFASVYLDFGDVNAFREAVERLEQKAPKKKIK